MFYGSVPAEAQAIMNKIVKEWDVSDIYVGCSGNFTLEKFIGPLGKFRLHSNDVTMYSQCLGAYFLRERVPLELRGRGEAVLLAGRLHEDRRGPDLHHAAVLPHRRLHG